MDWILLFEKQIVYSYYVFLILFNLATIYLILSMLFDDHFICVSLAETLKMDSLRKLVYLLFINGMSNMLFICVSLIAKLYS